MRVYRYVRDGDPRAPEEARRRFTAGRQGHLSDDPLTNMKSAHRETAKKAAEEGFVGITAGLVELFPDLVAPLDTGLFVLFAEALYPGFGGDLIAGSFTIT